MRPSTSLMFCLMASLAATALMLGAGASAQERRTNSTAQMEQAPLSFNLLDLRGRQRSALATGESGLSTDGLAIDEASRARASQDATRARQAPSPRVYRPVQAQVQAPVQADVTASVQAPVASLPLPSEPARLSRRRVVDDSPFAPIGVRSGGLVFYPSAEVDGGYDTNPNRTSIGRKGSPFVRGEGELRVQSDWLVHEVRGTVRAAYSEFTRASEASRPDADGNLYLRYDANRDLNFISESRFRIDTSRPGSPDLPFFVTNRPLTTSVGTTLGAEQRFNRLSFAVRGTVDTFDFQDGKLSNGLSIDQADRNYTQYGAALRAGYEITPGVQPFLEALADARSYSRTLDNAGFKRSSTGYGARAGTTFELTRLLTGEVSAGYQTRSYDDPRLGDISGPLVNASLNWSATPITTVRVRSAMELTETTLPGVSGVESRRAGVEVSHDLRRFLNVTGSLDWTEADYRGIRLREEGLAAAMRFEYRFSRMVVARASFTHERLKSTVPNADYNANIYLLGLRVQK